MHKAPPPEAAQILQEYKKRILVILETPYPLADDTQSELEPRAIPCSEDAEKLFWEFANEVEREMRPGGEYESIRPLAAKLPEHAARLATVIAGYQDLNVTELGRDDFLRGIRIASFYAAEAKRISSASRADPNILLAQKLLDWLVNEWTKPTVTARDIYTHGPNTIRDRQTALELAEIAGRTRLVEVTRDAPTRHEGVADHPGEKPMSIRDFLTRHSQVAPAPITPAAIMPIIPDLDIPDPEIASEPCNEEENPESLHLEPFYWDVESRSAATLGKGKHGVGVRAYAEHASTSVFCVGYARGDGPVEIWVPGQPIPEVVLAAAADPYCDWVAHHAAFERSILETILVSQHGWPMVPIERHVCTMTLALAHSLPGKLDGVAAILGLENQKDVATQREVAKMWKPRKPKCDEDPNKLYWVDSPELRVKLHLNCQKDTATMREAHRRLPPLLEAEREAAVIDAEINDTGVLIDTPLVMAASRLATQALAELDARIKQETDGAVSTASQTAKLKAWLVLQGVTLPRKQRKEKSGLQWKDSLDAGDIEKLLAEDLPNARVRSALEIRLQAAQSAASKVERMLRTHCADGRVRNIYRMYGAVTGRWSGEGFQPQNLKRPELLQTDEAITEAIEAILAGDYAGIKQRYDNVLGVVGDLCRSMLIPAPGHRFIVGDFAAVEARVLTWLAGDTDKLARFEASDCGRGREIYCETAEQVLGLDYEVTGKSPERALGKIFELGLGYQMGGDRLLTTIQSGNVPDTEDIDIEQTTKWVKKWRRQNPKIVEFWAALDATARAVVRNPEMVIACGMVQFQMCDGVLCLRLPSGRELKYPAPVVKPGRFGQQQISFIDMEAGRQRGQQMFGGKWAENVSSAVARDLLVEGMKRLRAAGYALVLHTHDEIVAEMPIGKGGVDEFKRLLTEVPAWARGLPVAAKVFECARFKKD